jgi:1,4-alpha-glucan branching enzyme
LANADSLGALCLVLHSHLPYVMAHGRWPHGMDWLNEAASETYVPLLNILYDLVEEGISPKLTIGLTPVLVEQLADDDFKGEFDDYLEQRIQTAIDNRKEFEATNSPERAVLAAFWQRYYSNVKKTFKERFHWEIPQAFRKLQDGGHIEIMTSAATHGYIPLLGRDECVQAQVRQGVAAYERHFGRRPRGFWLPECAYRPRYPWKRPVAREGEAPAEPTMRKGADEFLSESGIDYFVIDSHLLKGGRPIGVYIDRFEALKRLWAQFEEQYRPEEADKSPHFAYLVNSSGEPKRPVGIVTRDPETGIQVWSGEHGYPGDGLYLEFHKKFFPGGLRYWRVTQSKCDLLDKQVYEPAKAFSEIPGQAAHFVGLVKGVLAGAKAAAGRPGMLCAPYDAELYGHWWFEGPMWIYYLCRRVHNDPDLRMATCAEMLDELRPTTLVQLPEGSWGEGGFHWIWLNDWTTWTWKHIYEAEDRMVELCRAYRDSTKAKRVLEQAARELFLLEASDWQFLISTWSARDYAETRVSLHFDNFTRLAGMADRLGKGAEPEASDLEFLEQCERRSTLFPDVNLDWFAEVEHPPNPNA